MKNKLSGLVTWGHVKIFYGAWKFPDYFIYVLTIFVSLVIGYVIGVNQ